MPPKSSPAKPAGPAPQPAIANWKLLLLLWAITLAAYSNSFGLGIAYDGKALVTQDPRVQQATAANVKQIFATHYWWPQAPDSLYRPVTTLSFLFNYAVLGNGANGPGYHALNFVLHAINASLLFALALRVLGRPWPAFFVAALWAVHPVGTESVTYIAGRADLLATAGLLGGLVLYARLREMEAPPVWIEAALLPVAAIAAFSKETGVMLAGAMLLWDVSFPLARRNLTARAVAYGAAVATIGVWLVARWQVLTRFPVPVYLYTMNPIAGADFLTAKLTALKVAAFDLWLLIFPARLACDRSFNEIPLAGPGDVAGWASLVLIAAAAIVVVARHRRDRVVFFAAGFSALTLLPVSNLVVTIGAIMAERFLYLPAIGFAVAVVALAYRLAGERRAAIGLAALGVIYAGRTFARNPPWDSELSLFPGDALAAPGSARLHSLAGSALFDANQAANLDGATRELEQAWALIEKLPPSRILPKIPADLGMFYGLKGDQAGGAATAEGRRYYDRSLELLLTGKAASEALERDYDRAQMEHGRPLATRSAYAPVYVLLGTAYRRLGKTAEAIQSYREALATDPSQDVVFGQLRSTQLLAGMREAGAATMLEETIAMGATPERLALVRSLYQAVPGGECAVQTAPMAMLNLQCPRIQEDACGAIRDVAGLYRASRNAAEAARFGAMALQQRCR